MDPDSLPDPLNTSSTELIICPRNKLLEEMKVLTWEEKFLGERKEGRATEKEGGTSEGKREEEGICSHCCLGVVGNLVKKGYNDRSPKISKKHVWSFECSLHQQ